MLLLSAMAAATFLATAAGILAAPIREDLGISREQLGFVVTAHVAVGAVLSPRAGRAVDAVGGRNSVILVFVAAAASLAVMGLSVAYWILLLAGAMSAFGMAGGNPSTNKMIALHVPLGGQGWITGIKQSGVQAGAFFGGLLLPVGVSLMGWRPTMLAISGFVLVIAAAAARLLPADPPLEEGAEAGVGPLPPETRWLALYGALLGFGGAVPFFVPLFAEEAVGYGRQAAGFAAALIGLVSLTGRIGWARFAERGNRYRWTLGMIAVVSAVGGVILVGATTAPILLWLGVVVLATGSNSWNAVGMMAVIRYAGPARAGRASGVVMFGFLAGMGVASPLFGRTVDATGSYATMWWLATASFAAAAAVVWRWKRASAAVAPTTRG